MSHNITPRPFAQLLSFARTLSAGVAAHGDEVGLRQHDPAGLGADLAHFQASITDYQRCRQDHAARRATLRVATAEAKAWCARAVDTLKVHLGRRWNADWIAAGFTNGSIAIPSAYEAVLSSLAIYFETHPEHEVATLEITAPHLQTIADHLGSARSAAYQARDAEVAAKQARDAARTQMRRRIAGLRHELGFLLGADDSRWYAFGFQRPIDTRLPERVEKIAVQPLPGDEVELTWKPSARAVNYRVSKQVVGQDSSPVSQGLFIDPVALIGANPVDQDVIFTITARNRAGETRATEFRWHPARRSPFPQPEAPERLAES